MRSILSFAALSLGALVVLGPVIASAQDSPAGLHKRTSAGFSHRRVVNSRRTDLTQRASDASAIAALELVNSAITNNTALAAVNAGADPSKALAGSNTTNTTGSAGLKFPDLGFEMPSSVPSSTDGWWTEAPEYAFLGFGYEVTACQSASQLKKDFLNIRNKFNGRYVRLYGTCDNKGFYDTVVEAAWEATVGVHALIWFGFDGGNQWQTRRDTLFADLKSNPKAKFVTRLVQFGSEPLFDSVLSASALAAQVTAAKKTLAPLAIPVTVSDMVYGFTKDGGSQPVLEAIDQISIHTLPFFYTKASTGGAAWPLVQSDLNWAMGQNALKGKKIILDENGWPISTGSGVQANSRVAIASISNSQAYFDLLDSKCSYFKQANNGIGWFAHIYSEDMEPEYGILSSGGKLKFPFSPKTSC